LAKKIKKFMSFSRNGLNLEKLIANTNFRAVYARWPVIRGEKKGKSEK